MIKKDKYQVIKSNNYILSHYNMSLCAQKVLNLGITKIPRDYDIEKQIEIQMTASEIKRFLSYQGNNVYKMLDEISDELQNIKIVIENEENGKRVVEKVSPFPYAKYDDCNLTIRFEKFMNQHLLQLSSNYTQYDITETREFKCKYATRMYELCQCIAYKRQQEFGLDELKEIIGVRKEIQIESKGKKDEYIIDDCYPKWTDMRRYALDKAQKEMEEKCSISFTYEPIKTGRSVTSIIITVVENTVEKSKETVKKSTDVDIFDLIDECRAFLPAELSSKDIKALLELAEYNISSIRDNYELSKSQDINNLVAWLKTAIKEDYANKKVIKTVKKSKNKFNNYKQRDIDVEALERKLLNVE